MLRSFTLLTFVLITAADDPADLIAKTKQFLGPDGGNGFYGPFNRSVFSDDFVFRGPIIGPFNVVDVNLGNKAPYRAFQDISAGVQACWLDPSIPPSIGRMVYCVLYPTGTMTLDWQSPTGLIKAANQTIHSSGEVWGTMWNEEGKIKHQAIGAQINYHQGNGCGFGGAFALVCVAKGNTKATYDTLVASYISEWTLHLPKERTDPDKIPQWYKDFCTGPACL